MELLWAAGFIGASAILLVVLRRRLPGATLPALRPLAAVDALKGQAGRPAGAAPLVHVTLGQGNLISAASQTSVAGLNVLDYVAGETISTSQAPLVTVGDATLLPFAQAEVQQAHVAAGLAPPPALAAAQFIAGEADHLAYAAGAGDELSQARVSTNIMVGHLGPEVAFMGEAAARVGAGQVAGSDDPAGLAVAVALSENVLVGEEVFAAPAYLQGKPDQIAGVQVQDILRWLVVVTVLGLALYRLVAG